MRECRARFGPEVLRCSASRATACNSAEYHIVNARSHSACGAHAGRTLCSVIPVSSNTMTPVALKASPNLSVEEDVQNLS